MFNSPEEIVEVDGVRYMVYQHTILGSNGLVIEYDPSCRIPTYVTVWKKIEWESSPDFWWNHLPKLAELLRMDIDQLHFGMWDLDPVKDFEWI